MTPADGLERVVRAAARRPRAVLALRRAAVRRRRGAGARAAAERGDEHAGRALVGHLPGDRALPRALRRPRDRGAGARAAGAARADREPRPAARAGGLPVGQPARGPGGAGRRARARAPSWRAPSRCRSSTGPARSSTPPSGEIQDQLKRRLDAKGAEAEKAAAAARRLARRQGKPKAEQERLARSAEQLVYAQFVRDLLQLNLKYGLGVDETPRLDDPDFVATLVFDPKPRRDDAEGALRLPVPVVGVGGDPGPAEAGPDGRASASARPRSCARRCGCPTSRCATPRATR